LLNYKLEPKDLEEPMGKLHFRTKLSTVYQTWNDLVELKFDASSTVFPVIFNQLFIMPTCLEDYQNSDWRATLPKNADLWKGPRRRMYGILFAEKPYAMENDKTRFKSDARVEELCMRGEGSLDEAEWIDPIMPPFSYRLKDLYKDQDTREFNFDFKLSMEEFDGKYGKQHELRWKLFSWMINPKLENLALMLKLNSLDETDIYCVLHLYVMQHEWTTPLLTEKELKSFILVNLRMKTMTDEEIMNIPITFVPTFRSVQLATFYWRDLMLSFSDAVGHILAPEHFLLHNKFDGVLFQKIYLEFHDENNNKNDVIKKHEEDYVKKVYQLVTSNETKVKKDK